MTSTRHLTSRWKHEPGSLGCHCERHTWGLGFRVLGSGAHKQRDSHVRRIQVQDIGHVDSNRVCTQSEFSQDASDQGRKCGGFNQGTVTHRRLQLCRSEEPQNNLQPMQRLNKKSETTSFQHHPATKSQMTRLPWASSLKLL